MPDTTARGHSLTKLIDRTLPEIIMQTSKAKKNDIIYMCWMLNDIGVNLIEINRYVLEKIHVLPSGLNFIYRIQAVEELDLLDKYNITRVVANKELFCQKKFIDNVLIKKYEVTTEVYVENMNELYEIKNLLNESILQLTNVIRITGMSSFASHRWVEALKHLQEETGKKIDVCPANRSYLATAIAAEGFIHGAQYITTSFGGYGREHGYAALEEVLAAVVFLIEKNSSRNLKLLQELCCHFEKISGKNIAGNKAVIGKKIFNYESGIHADGIGKKPETYEPYEPGKVGLSRKLHIGKHSGLKAVLAKLEQLGVQCNSIDAENILYIIRGKSVELKRSLLDKEILDICYDTIFYNID